MISPATEWAIAQFDEAMAECEYPSLCGIDHSRFPAMHIGGNFAGYVMFTVKRENIDPDCDGPDIYEMHYGD